MSDLADAIREHLELKRQRGADPSEVAREEQEALAPVTRSHPVVTMPAPYDDRAEDEELAAESADESSADPSGVDEPPEFEVDDATQEFRVEHNGEWLAPEE